MYVWPCAYPADPDDCFFDDPERGQVVLTGQWGARALPGSAWHRADTFRLAYENGAVTDPATRDVLVWGKNRYDPTLGAMQGDVWRAVAQPTVLNPRLVVDPVAGESWLAYSNTPTPVGYVWRGGAWAASPPTRPFVPAASFLDPWRDRWTLLSGGLTERTPTGFVPQETALGTSFLQPDGERVVFADEARERLVLVERDHPGRRWVAPDRRGQRAFLQISVPLGVQANAAPTAIQLELVGGGTGFEPNSDVPLEGLEVWLWRWDEHRYVRVGSVASGPESEQPVTLEIGPDVAPFVGPDDTLHLQVVTTGAFERGDSRPELLLDLLKVRVDLRPSP